MKIIEVRDGFLKFEADKSIYLSSFIHVKGMEKVYIAQVIKLNSFGEQSVAVAKMLFLFENQELKAYDRTEPPKDSVIKDFTSEILSNSIRFKDPVIIGKTADNSNNITIDASAFNKKMMICADTKISNNILVRNFTKQFLNLQKKVIIIDTLGILDGKKYIAGTDFKLPLDEISLDFLYESCLSDATEDSKKTIIELFNELKEYSKSVEFVPFDVLKNIVDNMVDKEHVFKLLVLKNKLSKYSSMGYFASKQEEVNVLNKIINSNTAILDISKLDTLFQNRYLTYIFSKLSNQNNVQVFLEAANTVSKANLKTALSDNSLSTTFITHSKFKYLNDMKSMFDNFIVEPSITINEAFKIYDNFLKGMKGNSCLITGEATNYIPIVINVQPIDEVPEIIKTDNPPVIYEKGDIEPVDEPEEANESTESETVTETEAEIEQGDEFEQEPEQEQEPELESEQDYEIIEIDSEDSENEVKPQPSQEEIISSIDKKSEDAIAKVAENLEQPENIELFNNESDEEKEPEEYSPDDETEDFNTETDDNNTETDDFSEIDKTEDIDDIDEDDDNDDIYDTVTDEELEFEEYNPAQDNTEEFITDEDAVFDKELEIVEYDSEQNTDYQEEFDNTNSEQIIEFDESENSDNLEDELSADISDVETDDNTYTEEFDELENEISSEEEYGENFEEDIEPSQQTNDADNEPEELETEEEALINTDNENLIEIENSDLELDDIDSENDNLEQQKLAQIEAQFEQPTVMPVSNSADDADDFSEIVELDPSEADENDIVIDMSESSESDVVDEEVERKIMEDVDKVYTTLKNDNQDNTEAVEDEYSESDLDLIDELNSEDTEILEDESSAEIEELPEGDGILDDRASKESIEEFNSEILEKKDSTTPIVPVYDASIPQEDIVMSDPIEQGDNVYHAKYGNGVVEKMIKYGNKSLYSINFENIGRRLLDPTLTEIKKQ